jgi:hypothetical protein
MTDGNFEAKLCAIRKNKDGLVVSLVIHPHDASRDLMNLDIGARVMIGWAECTDAPDDTRAARVASEDSVSVTEPPRETASLTIDNIPDRNRQAIMGTGPYAPVKPRTPFAELPPSQQAGICCKDEDFRAFLAQKEGHPCSMAVALLVVRDHCGITSRAQLDSPICLAAREKWQSLYDEFAAWKLTRQYAESLRS